MAILNYRYNSQVLDHQVGITVCWPTTNLSYFDPQSEGHNTNPHGSTKPKTVLSPKMKFQVLYLMNGGSEDETGPYRSTNIERWADENQLMVVTAGIPNTFGADAGYGINYFKFLTEELPVVCESLFHASDKREDRFVAGYAMGANVALGMAVKRPDLFSMCVDLSGGIGMTLSTETIVNELNGERFRKVFPKYNATFGPGDKFPGSSNDLYPFAKQHAENGDELCEFYLLSGEKEFIRSRVENDARILKELGYPVHYICAEGYDHDYNCWNHFLEVAVKEWLPLKHKVLVED